MNPNYFYKYKLTRKKLDNPYEYNGITFTHTNNIFLTDYYMDAPNVF